MKHHLIPLSSASAWRDALSDLPHAFAHTWENCYAMSLTTGYPTFLYCFESSSARIVCPLAERDAGGGTNVDVVTPYGFSGFVGTGACPEFPGYWSEFTAQQKWVCSYLALNPVLSSPEFTRPADRYRSNVLYYLDLTLGPETLFENLHRNRKRQLRADREQQAELVFDKAATTRFVLEHHAEFMERIQGSAANRFSVATLEYLCGLPNVLLIGAAGADGMESVNVFAYTRYHGDSLINVPLPQGRRHAVSLLWSGVQELSRLGVAWLNLGGGVREGDSVAEHKRRFGAVEKPFYCVKQVHQPDRYDELCRRAGVDAGDFAGYFPAYRRTVLLPGN